MPERSAQGRTLISRRAIEEVVRGAVLGSYGVVGLADDAGLARLLRALGLGRTGIWVQTGDPFSVDLRLTIAYGLPVAEVARQVDSAVRYALRRTLDREPDRLTIHIDGLRFEPSSVPPPGATETRSDAASTPDRDPTLSAVAGAPAGTDPPAPTAPPDAAVPARTRRR
jgi:uncharacterized alkaline shock family protein YloU